MRIVSLRFFCLLLVLLFSAPALRAQVRYWDANYDSLRATLRQPAQQADTARLRTLQHLVDLTELTDALRREQALPLLDELLIIDNRTHLLADARPYQALRDGVAHWLEGRDHRATLGALHRAIALFDESRRPIPRLLIDLAPVYNLLKDDKGRFEYVQNKLNYYRLNGPIQNEAACYLVLAGSFRHRGDFNQAISHYLHAVDAFRQYERSYYITEIMVTGSAYAEWGNMRKAEEYFRRALRLVERYQFKDMRRYYTLQGLARVYGETGRYEEALAYADQALYFAQHDPLIRQMGTAYGLVLKSSLLVQRHPEQVRPLLERAQSLADSLHLTISGRLGLFPLDVTWAQYYEAIGDYDRAEARLLQALHKATSGNLHLLRPPILRELIQLYNKQHEPEKVLRYTKAYFAITDSLNTARNAYNIAQYEGERTERQHNAQLTNMRQTQAVQALRLRQRTILLIIAVLTAAVVSGLGVVLYRQLQLNRRTLAQLRQTQKELIAAEKWAFVGEVSAGIAHELQNPLNFMKRFAEVSTHMVDGMENHRNSGELQHEILAGLKQNLQEISQHGLRASSIIRDMLEHSRSGTNTRQATDLNALVTEHLRLAYEDQHAQHPDLQAAMQLDLDPALAPVNLVPQDLGRVLLNLLTNAFYAVHRRQQTAGPGYQPTVQVSTRQLPQAVEIRVRDNGPGIAADVLPHVFEPFFTTKPVGEGTGLGLSLSHDIVTKGHGGGLRIDTQPGVYTEFIVTLPA
ncbi:ATP-binding protein [Hymenobacter sp. CRA2]|uniref:ATP-binding protein n=1 Tax=Hymenobacter sp. CRA2 TaxID=1955620 RepID=UPI00098F7756|nr:ATP-binding protein [Hymenobacter sp. CRA2]OON69455.1 hypothetical protein B0919_09270 [Hymenobacter sp. CRA2]